MNSINDLPPGIQHALLEARHNSAEAGSSGAFRSTLEAMPDHVIRGLVGEAMAPDAALPIAFEPPESLERDALITALLALLEELDESLSQQQATSKHQLSEWFLEGFLPTMKLRYIARSTFILMVMVACLIALGYRP